MEIIIALVAGILVAGIGVFFIMRHQLMQVRDQLSSTQQALTNEQQKAIEAEKQLSRKEIELELERKNNEESRKQADEKLAEQIKYLQAELTNTTQKLLDVRSEKLEQTNRTQMSSIIDPLKETISKLEKEMKDTQMQHGNTTTRLEQSIKKSCRKNRIHR